MPLESGLGPTSGPWRPLHRPSAAEDFWSFMKIYGSMGHRNHLTNDTECSLYFLVYSHHYFSFFFYIFFPFLVTLWHMEFLGPDQIRATITT